MKTNAFIYQTLLLITKKLNSKVLPIDRFHEPAFAVYSGYSTSDFGVAIYDHKMNMIGRRRGVSFGELTASNFKATSATVSTGASRIHGTSANSLLGNFGISTSKDGSHYFYDISMRSQVTVGTWVGNTTPDLVIHCDANNEAWIGNKSLISNKEHSPYGDVALIPNLVAEDKVGTISYNENVHKLCILQSDGSYNHKATVWSNVLPPKEFKTNAEFFGQLIDANKIESTNFTERPYTRDIEDNYRGVVVLADNGDVIVTKMIPSNGIYCIKFTYNESTNDYTTPTTTLWDAKYSTTYGFANGVQYGIRHNITNDGRFIIAYAPAYYYGSGYYLTITDTQTSKVKKAFINDTANGYAFLPLGDSNFVYSKSLNANSNNGMNIGILNMLSNFTATTVDADDISFGPLLQKHFETSYTSTDYPTIISVTDADYNKFIGE